MMRIALVVATSLTLCAAVASGPFPSRAGDQHSMAIHLDNPWARRAAHDHGGGGTAAVYVTISNHGRDADALLAATTDAANAVELHETAQVEGKMVMRPLPRIAVPAGGKVEMKPGGYHLMLLGLRRDLHPGDTVRVTLTFEKAGQLDIETPVR